MEDPGLSSCFFCGKPAQPAKFLRKSYYILRTVWSERVNNNLVYHNTHDKEIVMIPRCEECEHRHMLEKRIVTPLTVIFVVAGILGFLYVMMKYGFWKGVGVGLIGFVLGIAAMMVGQAIIYGGIKKTDSLNLDASNNFPRVKTLKSNGWKEGETPNKGDMDAMIRRRRGF